MSSLAVIRRKSSISLTTKVRNSRFLCCGGRAGSASLSCQIIEMNNFRVFLLAVLLLVSPLLPVARSQSEAKDADADVDVGGTDGEVGEVEIAGEPEQDVFDVGLSSAPGVEMVSVFPKNSAKLVTAGEETELLVGLKNDGQSSLNVIAARASVHLPLDHSLLVQNLTAVNFNNASVPPSAQATFPYFFVVSQYMQPGSFDLVGTIYYEIDDTPYQSVFYNGTIEVVESGGFVSVETVFLVSLGAALLLLLGLWIYGQAQRLTKKSKKVAKVEVGTRTDDSLNEWLQGTAYTRTVSTKAKKK